MIHWSGKGPNNLFQPLDVILFVFIMYVFKTPHKRALATIVILFSQ